MQDVKIINLDQKVGLVELIVNAGVIRQIKK